ncbi:MAG: hypothetical protein E6R06_26065 [Mycobacterium sp.]|jgi:hypothetical protein|nr:MAG: hypothetical protein E6R06_26065 [Mycobacterium sp.]
MARSKPGFNRDPKAIKKILLKDPGGIAALRAAAQQLADRIPGARIVEYETDRHVVAVQVPADEQAKNGAGTKAASAAGLKRR